MQAFTLSQVMIIPLEYFKDKFENIPLALYLDKLARYCNAQGIAYSEDNGFRQTPLDDLYMRMTYTDTPAPGFSGITTQRFITEINACCY